MSLVKEIVKDYKLQFPLSRENDDLVRTVHIAMKGITNDISNDFQFNTVISKYRELTNAIYEWAGKKSDFTEERDCSQGAYLFPAASAPGCCQQHYHYQSHRTGQNHRHQGIHSGYQCHAEQPYPD